MEWRVGEPSGPSLMAGVMKQVFERHMFEHPTLAYDLCTRDGSALKTSAFLTRNQWHRLALYNECPRRLRVELGMAVAMHTCRLG